MKTEVSAPGKVFLSGEYFVLDGSLATILSTKQRAKITIEENGILKSLIATFCSFSSFNITPFNKLKNLASAL